METCHLTLELADAREARPELVSPLVELRRNGVSRRGVLLRDHDPGDVPREGVEELVGHGSRRRGGRA